MTALRLVLSDELDEHIGEEPQPLKIEVEVQPIKPGGKEVHDSLFWRSKAIRAEADADWVPICLDALYEIRSLLIEANQLMKAIEPFPELVEPAREYMKDAGRRAHEAILLLDKGRVAACTQSRTQEEDQA